MARAVHVAGDAAEALLRRGIAAGAEPLEAAVVCDARGVCAALVVSRHDASLPFPYLLEECRWMRTPGDAAHLDAAVWHLRRLYGRTHALALAARPAYTKSTWRAATHLALHPTRAPDGMWVC